MQDQQDVLGVEVVLEVADHQPGQARAHVLVRRVQGGEGRHHRLEVHALVVQVPEIIDNYIKIEIGRYKGI